MVYGPSLEVPHASPENRFQPKIKLHPDEKSHGQSIQQRHSSKRDWHFSDDFWVKEPRHSENILAVMW